MIDIYKVIRALENCTGQPKCKDCPWSDCEVEHEVVNSVPYGLLRDAIALLKEKEPVVPETNNDGVPEPYTAWWYVCGNCGYGVDIADKYCSRCGRRIKWGE